MSADWVVDEVRACPDCSVRPDGRWAFCGWHENVVAAVRIVEVTAGTLLREGTEQ